MTACVQPACQDLMSPFERALSVGQASAPPPGLIMPSGSPGALVSPFDSATSFPDFLSAASMPNNEQASKQGPVTAVSPLESALSHFDLERRASTQLHQISISQPPSPKTPTQSIEPAEAASHQMDYRRIGSEIASCRNPLSGHPR